MVSREPLIPRDAREELESIDDLELAHASLSYRLRAWRAFQRALDPLGPPKPFRLPKPPPQPH